MKLKDFFVVLIFCVSLLGLVGLAINLNTKEPSIISQNTSVQIEEKIQENVNNIKEWLLEKKPFFEQAISDNETFNNTKKEIERIYNELVEKINARIDEQREKYFTSL